MLYMGRRPSYWHVTFWKECLLTCEFCDLDIWYHSFYLRLNKLLSKQRRGWWFGTPLLPIWRHCNDHREYWLKMSFASSGYELRNQFLPSQFKCYPNFYLLSYEWQYDGRYTIRYTVPWHDSFPVVLCANPYSHSVVRNIIIMIHISVYLKFEKNIVSKMGPSSQYVKKLPPV